MSEVTMSNDFGDEVERDEPKGMLTREEVYNDVFTKEQPTSPEMVITFNGEDGFQDFAYEVYGNLSCPDPENTDGAIVKLFSDQPNKVAVSIQAQDGSDAVNPQRKDEVLGHIDRWIDHADQRGYIKRIDEIGLRPAVDGQPPEQFII